MTNRISRQIILLGFGVLFFLSAVIACGGGGGGSGDDPVCTDADADGYYAENGCGTAVDCNDGDAAINPGAVETIDDSIDQNCDGSDLKTWYADSDGDGYGDSASSTTANSQPIGYVADNTDCDDDDTGINPGETEILNDGIDQNCNGLDLRTWYADGDGDGYGKPTGFALSEGQLTGYVLDSSDCDDSNAASYPGAPEVCENYLDNDCDGSFACGDSDCSLDAACADDFYNSLGMGFKSLLADTFTMGSPPGETGRDSDETEHSVTLSQFYMQTTEVTQGQWQAVTGSNPSYFSDCGYNCPVEQVSWNDVQNFITALNGLGEGTYRLPTESEWEYAARAGSGTAFSNGGITTYGNMDACNPDANLNDMGWYCHNCEVSYNGCYDYSVDVVGAPSCAGINPVAQKQANNWGLYDMHGNVWEWCQDWTGTYPAGPVIDPTGAASGTERVVRGGGWTSYAKQCRSANRGSDAPTVSTGDLGFRLVVSPP